MLKGAYKFTKGYEKYMVVKNVKLKGRVKIISNEPPRKKIAMTD